MIYSLDDFHPLYIHILLFAGKILNLLSIGTFVSKVHFPLVYEHEAGSDCFSSSDQGSLLVLVLLRFVMLYYPCFIPGMLLGS